MRNCGLRDEVALRVWKLLQWPRMGKITGIVTKGNGKGKKLGFPTANVALSKKIPPGIYAGKVLCGSGTYKSAIYVPRNSGIVEAHLLEYEGNLYGQEITITFYDRIREDREFASEGELIEAIRQDIEKIKKT